MTTTFEAEPKSSDKRHPSFQQWFLNDRNTTFFVEEEETVYSLALNASLLRTDPDGDEIYECCHIGWQDENYQAHTVCGTGWNRDKTKSSTMIYNATRDIILCDAYLGDKYGDCADGWVSERLETMFKKVPTLLSRRG